MIFGQSVRLTCRFNAALHYEHEINMHNADTVLDKVPGQEAFCTVLSNLPQFTCTSSCRATMGIILDLEGGIVITCMSNTLDCRRLHSQILNSVSYQNINWQGTLHSFFWHGNNKFLNVFSGHTLNLQDLCLYQYLLE